MVGLGYYLVQGDKQIDQSDDWVIHTHEVIIEAEELNSLLLQMLAAQRGFIISDDDYFLKAYDKNKTELSRHIASLSELVSNNPSQVSRLKELANYFQKFDETLSARVAIAQKTDAAEVLSDVSDVSRLTSDMSRIVGDFLREEYQLLNQRIKIVENKKDEYLNTLIIGGVVAFLLLMMFNAYLLRVQSKRSAAETALSDREEIFRLAVEGTQDGIFDWNIKTNDVFYSKQFRDMLGYDEDDFTGTADDVFSRLHPDEVTTVREYIDLYLAGQLSEYSNTFRLQHKSGRWVWINSRAQLIWDKKGNPSRMIGAHTDISALKEHELRLQEGKAKAEDANRAKSDFLAHMSHEIRTPLTTISGVSEILQQAKSKLDKKQQKLLDVLSASSTTLKDLISDILDFSKIESGELELDETEFDLDDAFEHIISIMSVRASEKELDFVLDYNAVKDIRFYGDPLRLRQILINLIGNAVKFTEKGYIHVIATADTYNNADILRIDVKDSGIGITEDKIDVIFERFKQADASVSRKYGGTGLGLPISKRLATAMGGDILVESNVGEGTTFSVILPMRTVKAPEKTANSILIEAETKHHDKLKKAIKDERKVLLVEDYEGNIVVLSYILETLGLSFDIAETGLEALNAWKKNHYDLILMDIQMPEMDGFTATSTIRGIEEEHNLERTPIVGMTAHALVGDKDKCIACGMDAYLPKPIVEQDFQAMIYKFLKPEEPTKSDASATSNKAKKHA